MDPCYRIKVFREWAGISQPELGVRAFGKKVDQKLMHRLETTQEPKITQAYAIAKALGMRVGDLVVEQLDPNLLDRFRRKYGTPPFDPR